MNDPLDTDAHTTVGESLAELRLQDVARHATETALLLAEEPAWVHRRVEKIVFLTSNRIRRTMSVDFTIPDLYALHKTWLGSPNLFPIALPRKRPLKDFDVRDEAGRPLPNLTRDQNSEIAAQMVFDQARALIGAETIAEDENAWKELMRLIKTVVGASLGDDDRATDIERAKRRNVALQRFRDASTDASGATIQIWLRELWADNLMNPLLRQLASRFILFVRLQDAQVGQRRIIKMGYEEEVERIALLPLVWELARQSQYATAARLTWDGFREMLGWKLMRVRIGTRALFGAESYHIEVVVPDDVKVKRAELGLRQRIDGTIRKTPLAREAEVDRVHLYQSGAWRSGLPRQRNASGNDLMTYVDLGLALRPGLLLAPLVVLGVVLGVMLGGVISHATHHSAGVDAATALLVVLPAAFVPYLLPGEHRLVRKLYRTLRGIILMASILTFYAGCVLAINFSTDFTEDTWIAVASAAAVGTTIVAGAVAVARRRPPSDWVANLELSFD